MINIKKVDLTTPAQKGIAGIILGLFLVGAYFLLPPLVTIFKNIWLLIGMGVPLLFLAYNYQLFWDMFKRLSWNLTKKIISSNKLWYMYRYHEYMLLKIESLDSSIKEVSSLKISTQRSIEKLITDAESFKKEAISHQQKGSPATIIKILENKVAVNQKQIDSRLPKLEYIKTQEKALVDIYNNWEADTEILKHTLDAKAEEYKLMKELSKASDTAMAFLQKDSPELREFNESLRQIEKSVSDYTSNVENFQRKVLPTITMMNVQSEVNAEEGAKLIEEYKAHRIQIDLK